MFNKELKERMEAVEKTVAELIGIVDSRSIVDRVLTEYETELARLRKQNRDLLNRLMANDFSTYTRARVEDPDDGAADSQQYSTQQMLPFDSEELVGGVVEG